MERVQGKQTGFSIIELLLVVIAVGVIGAGGWFVYQHNRVKPTEAAAGTQITNQGTTQQTATSTPASATTVVKIPELGIQISVPNSIKDLTYEVGASTFKNGTKDTYALFSTKALTNADANCGPSAAPLGGLNRGEGQYPTQSEDETNVLDYGQLVKQFPTFYITVSYSHVACSTGKTLPSPVSGHTWMGEFSGSLSSITELAG